MVSAPAICNLSGLILDNKWKVLHLIVPPACATGGGFSAGYIAESPSGSQGFLKAFDFSEAANRADPVVMLNAMTAAFLFERELLRRCQEKQLDRIVSAIGSGRINAPAAPGG